MGGQPFSKKIPHFTQAQHNKAQHIFQVKNRNRSNNYVQTKTDLFVKAVVCCKELQLNRNTNLKNLVKFCMCMEKGRVGVGGVLAPLRNGEVFCECL